MLQVICERKQSFPLPDRPDLIGGKEWVEALMSGKYKPVDGKLKGYILNSNGAYGHCCLGVKCEIDHILRLSGSVWLANIGEGSSSGTLPYNHHWNRLFGGGMDIPYGFEVMVKHDCKSAGCLDRDPVKIMSSLAELNDRLFEHRCKPENVFKMVAAVIQFCWNCLPETQSTESHD